MSDPWNYVEQVIEDAAMEDAYYRERDAEIEWEERERAKQREFDRLLDEYQEREAEAGTRKRAG